MKDIYYDKAEEIVNKILENTTYSIPGSLPWLLFGEQPSNQSLFIKIGRNFEKWFKFIVEDNGFELLPDGVIKDIIDGKSKDIDLLFVDNKNKIVYYRELKSNIELDTEKLPATYNKIKKINEYLISQYDGYKIDTSLMNWSVYNKDILPKKYDNKINEFEKNGVMVSYPCDLFDIVGVDISDDDYYKTFRKIGDKIKSL